MLPLLSWTLHLLVISLGGVGSLAADTNIQTLPISNVLSSMLSETPNASGSRAVCTDIKTCRTLDQIVVSCLATILACAWLAAHRNIPAPAVKRPHHGTFFVRSAKRAWHTVLDQKEPALVFAVALLAPEWILAWAVRQALCARALRTQLETARRQAIGTRHGRDDGQCEECGERRCKCTLDTAAQRVGKGDEGWTTAHAFLVIMGGFQSCNTHGPIHPLSPASVVELVRRGHLVPPTAGELSNQSKGDALSKGAAILQASWFVIQCIARRGAGLPVTSLEVTTLAYTVMAVAICIAWWDKPRNVSCAVRVPDEEVQAEEAAEKYNSHYYTSVLERITAYVMGGQDAYVELRKRKGVPTFWAGGHDRHHALIANIVALLAGMVFGAVHRITWYSEFQQPPRWISCTTTVVGAPAGVFLLGIAAFLVGRLVDRLTDRTVPFPAFDIIVGSFSPPILAVYILSRIDLVVLSLTSLRGLPFEAYQAIQWTTVMPHI